MSTKTSIKRIALVAVSALGFGLLSVVPAKAAAGTSLAANDVTVVSITPFSVTTAAGTAITHSPTFAVANNGKVGDQIVFTVAVASKPVGSTATPTLTAGTATASREYSLAQGNQATASTASVTATLAAKAGANEAIVGTAGNAIGTVSFTPDVPGEYQLTVTATSYAVAALSTAIANSGVGKLGVYASGIGASVASSGIGNTTATAVSGGQAKINFTPGLGTTPATAISANTIWTVTSSGVGSIINAEGSFAVLGTDGAGANHAQTATTGTVATPGTGFARPTSSTGGFESGVTLGNGSTTTPFEFIITASSAVAGTQTLTFSAINPATGAPTLVGTQNIVWSSTASSASSALSTAFIGTGSGSTCATTDATAATLRFSATAAGPVANICVTLNDTNGVAINGQGVSVTVSGPGLIIAEADQNGVATGNARVAALTATQMASTNKFQIGITPDGTKGASTISIYNGTTLIATKTLTFYGTVATLTATQNYAIARSGVTAATLAASASANKLGSATSSDTGLTVATSPAVTVVAKDSDGNVVPGLTVTSVIADPTVISSTEIAEAAGTALTIGAAGGGTHLVAVRSAIGGVSGKSTTVTFRTPNPLVPGAFITSDPVTFTLGGTKTGGTVTMTLDKATYLPGERMVVTYTAKDASGNKVYDGVTVADPSANKNVSGLTGGVFVNGEEIIGDEAGEYVYAPTVSGPFTLTLGTGTATGAEITATATVGDDAATAAAAAAADAAAEAIDAANAATDAANLAAEAADAATVAAEEARDAADAATAAVEELATQVATLMAALKAQITTLANTVAKIAKKVKA